MKGIHCAGYMMLALATGCGGSEASRPAPATIPAPAEAAPAPAPAAPPANPDDAAVEAARPSFRACYDKARSANAALGRTTATLSLGVNEAGTVSTVDVEYKHRFDEASKTCMRDAAFAITFPKGQPRKVVVPLTFETK
jgi:hypothetical protein